MKKLLYIILIVSSCSSVIYGQTGRVTAFVQDEIEGNLPGVSIRVAGQNLGAVTNLDGRFLLQNIPFGKHELLITYIGYANKTISVEVSETSLLDLGTIQLSPNGALGEVLITGQMQEGESKAINMMLQSERLMTVVSAEGIAKMPDKNAAEALQRIVGVAMERDQGEGRFVSFRGTPSDWSSALVNGDRLPVADEESKTRALNFDILPANMVEYMIFSKSITPELEGDAIGGSANFITRKPPQARFIEAQIGGGFNTQARGGIGSLSLLYGNRSRNKKWAFISGLSWYNRDWGTDNFQLFFNSNYNHAITRFELRDYLGNRDTKGFNAAVEYSPSKGHTLQIKTLFGRMRDDEYNRKVMFAYNTGVGQSIKLQSIHNKLITQLAGGAINGNHRLTSRLNATWKLASYHNQFNYGNVPYQNQNDPRNGYFVVEFEKNVQYTDFLYLDENNQQTDEFNAVERFKLLDIDSPVEGYGDNYQNIQPTWRDYPAFFEKDTLFLLSRTYTETNQTKESDPIVANLDLNWAVSNSLKLKGGFKYRYKTGERKVGLSIWDRNTQAFPFIPYRDFETESAPPNGGFLEELGKPYGDYSFKFLSKSAQANFLQGLGEGLIYQPFSPLTPYFQQFVGSSYRYRESVTAGYIQADVKLWPGWQMLAGLRTEYTQPRVSADTVLLGVTIQDAQLKPVESGASYFAFLPMLNVKWEVGKAWNLRLAATRSFRRPNFNEFKPGQAAIDYTNFDLIYGNPALKPSYSLNFDVGSEWYFGLQGMASVGLFYKQITDHIYTAFESSNLSGAGISNDFQIPGGIISKIYQNAPTAYVAGFEAVWNRKFNFLKGKWRNLGLSANYAHSESSMRIEARSSAQPLPRQSKHLLNIALFYEGPKLRCRLGLNRRSPFLAELNLFAVTDPNSGKPVVVHQDNDFDMFVGVTEALDASIQWRLKGAWSVFAEVNNLTNTPYTLYRGRKERPVKTEYYGQRSQIGLRFSMK
jgi:TonB-dependent receptor